MASTSVSSRQNNFKYDVFLSFRGEDTRKNFVDHLYHALKQKSIVTYKDDENIKQGKMISDGLIKAIEDSKFYIIIFSKNYASSSWCLEELVKIMECQKMMTGHAVYPVFYDVEPAEVRKQSGSVGDAFAKHKEDEAAGKWREAMKEASDLAGFELKSIANGHEAKFIQKIIAEISLELRVINSSTDGNLIGMGTRVNKVVSSLEPSVNDVRMIGIWGMGGAGKTTLARAIFDQISIQFEGESFIENVRDVSKASLKGLKKLQKQVLSDVLKDQSIEVSSVSGGKSMMQMMMRGKKVLVVLDDVDHKDQLEALAGDRNWFKPGSRIIITTRDEQVLVAHRVSLIHNVTLLSQAEAGCLFSRYAFGRENPIQGYEELSGKVLQYAHGLPLTIKVMGSFLCGQSEPYWIHAIERLKTIPLMATMDRLKISFDGLEKEYKEIFLDVACILKGWSKNESISALKSRGFHAEVGLRVLEQKSLITVSGSGPLGMHDHLAEMGRNIVRRKHPHEPNKHSRLWIDEEIEDILANDMGTQATKCLYFRSPGFSAEIAIKGLAKMKDLRFICIHLVTGDGKSNIVQFDRDSKYLPSSLRFMRWWGFPFSSLPNTFQGKYLVELEMHHSNIVQLWEHGEGKVLNNLRFLDIGFAKLRTFDLRVAPNLERLLIRYCFDFAELHIPADLTLTGSKLTNLHLGNTLNLKKLKLSHSKLKTIHLSGIPNLETLELQGCHDLVKFEMPQKNSNLEHLDLTDSNITNLHLGNSPNLKKLKLSHSKLKTLHLGNSPNLKSLILDGCNDLVELHLSQSWLTNLHLRNTPNLKMLELRDCCDLVEFQMPAESLKLEEVYLTHSQLKTIHLGNSPNLERLILGGCNDLVELQMPFENLKLEELDLSHSQLKTIHLGNTPNLERLVLEGCNDLVELQMPTESLKLVAVNLSHSKLKVLHLGSTPILETLILEGCNDLVELQLPGESLKLKYLNLSHLKLKTLQLGSTPNLEPLIFKGCNDFVDFHMPSEVLKLEYLDLSHSKLKTLHLPATPNLETLILNGCKDLVELQMPAESLKLEYLNLSHSKLKTLHLRSSPNLEMLILEGCNDLVELQMPAESPKLIELFLRHSKLKTLHLGSTPNLKILVLEGCKDLVELQMRVESLKLEYLDFSHTKLKTLDLGLTPNLEWLKLKNCYDLVEINAPIGCGRFKSFEFDKWSDHEALSELHLIAKPTDVCPLHSDNDSPKLQFECYYKEDPDSSFGNLERLISIGLCACTNLGSFSRSICGLQCLTKLRVCLFFKKKSY